MAEKVISFSGSFLAIDDKKIAIDDFQKHFSSKSYSSTDSGNIFIFNLEFKDSYMLLTMGNGKAKPWNPVVYDVTTNDLQDNPRNTNQVEPKETFCLIDFGTSFIWISNSKKKNFIIDFIRSKFDNQKIICKDFYDQEKFISTLKRLDEIRVSTVPNLFSQTGV